MSRRLRLASPCPRADDHAPDIPENFAALAGWMHTKSRTHRQVACRGCGRWLVWLPRTDVREMTR